MAPGPLGGDRRSGRIEGHAPLILGLLERKPDIALSELGTDLAQAGVPVSAALASAVLRVATDHAGHSQRMQPSSSAPAS